MRFPCPSRAGNNAQHKQTSEKMYFFIFRLLFVFDKYSHG